MGLNIFVFAFVGLLFHSIKAQPQGQGCTQQESQSVRSCLQQATQGGGNTGVFQLASLNQESGPCLQQAGCTGASSGPGFGSVLSQFGFGGNNQQQPQQQQNNGNDDQCYNAVTKQVRQYMGECVKSKSPNFNQNDAGLGGQGGQGGQGQQSNVMQQLNQKCNNDKDKVSQVKACMLNTPAGNQQYQQVVQKGCQCTASVSQSCRQQLEQHRQAACQCAKDVDSKYGQFEQQNQQVCQGQNVEPDGMVAVFQKMDCNNNPCQNQG